MEATPEAIAQATMTKAHFPYRRVCIVVEPSGEFYILAKPTMRQANDAARKGASVYEVA